MKYFLDTEFYEKPGSIDLISIGIVSENGDTFYAEVTDCNKEEIEKDNWLKENVIQNLKYWDKNFDNVMELFIDNGESTINWNLYCRKEDLKAQLITWFARLAETKPIFYGYYADYDWVVFCWIFGRMIDLPKLFPMYCNDLKQTMDEMNLKNKPEQEGKEHNSLDDAIYTRKLYYWIEEEAEKDIEKFCDYREEEWNTLI